MSKATIELEPQEAKSLLSLVQSDGKGMAPKRLTEALRKRLEAALAPSAATAEAKAPLEAAKHTPMMRKRAVKKTED
jgi:hypothetical protein